MTKAADHVAALVASIDGRACPMAVVDYAGTRDGLGLISEASPPSRRYGTRDMRHVAIYGLKVVSLNPAAQAA